MTEIAQKCPKLFAARQLEQSIGGNFGASNFQPEHQLHTKATLFVPAARPVEFGWWDKGFIGIFVVWDSSIIHLVIESRSQ